MIEPQEQASKLIELAKLKAELSTSFYAGESYRSLIEKILSPSELLSEEECTQATSKEFAKTITAWAQSTAKVAQWHRENKSEEAIAFLLPTRTVEAVGSEQSDL